MKNGVKFGDKYSIDDWDLLLISKNIEPPEPKTIGVEVPGSDGVKDLTEIFGIKYYNRTLTFEFDIFSSPSTWQNLYSEISKYLHGKELKIVLDIDPEFYYYGRCKITSFTNNSSIAHIIISCDCKPYKYKLNKTISTVSVEEGNTYIFNNLYREVVPEITTDSVINFDYEGKSYSLDVGTYKILDISLKEGENSFTITSGSGELTMSYQEAIL